MRELTSPVWGAVCTAAALVGATVVLSLDSALNTYCGDDERAAAGHALRQQAFVIFLLAALVPAAWALVARLTRRPAWPWAVTAALMVVVAAVVSANTQPGYFCL